MPTSKTKAAKSTTAKKSSAAPAKNADDVASKTPRRLRLPAYKPFSLKKRIKPVRPKLPGAFRLFGRSLLMLKRHFKLFLTLLVVYIVLDLLFVHGFSFSTGLDQLKSSLNKSGGKLFTGFALFTYLLGNSGGSGSDTAGVYQTLLLIIMSLAVIWTLRQLYAGKAIRAREALYRGMAPLIPIILVLLVIGLQLIPLIVGGALYNIVISGGIAVSTLEKILWALLFLVLAIISIYMICSSAFALYIVTLPEMTPMKALRSARQLVRYRRWVVLRKVLFLPLALIVLALIIMVPVVLLLTPAAGWLFFLLTLIALFIIHGYMYLLYRELLNE